MSDRFPGSRRVAARIVPITRVDPPRVQKPNIEPDPPVLPPPAPPAKLQVRQRLQASPLVAPTRFYRPLQTRERAGADAPAGTSAPVGRSRTEPEPEPGRADARVLPGARPVLREQIDPVTHNDHPEQAPEHLILWEQPPQPQDRSGIDVPRWVNNVYLAPSDAEFTELATYLQTVVDGFADFCRRDSVIDGGNWQARIPMPGLVMPETVLDINISPMHAKMRFETDHPMSRELIRRNVGELRAQVVAALDDHREVEVTLW